MNDINRFAEVPMHWVGPLLLKMDESEELLSVPLATFEKPLWPSVQRGARVSVAAGGIEVIVTSDHMTRSVVIQAPTAREAYRVGESLKTQGDRLQEVVASTSRYGRLQDWHMQIVGNLLYLRFHIQPQDAAGHNMATKAADALLDWILARFPSLRYVSISGNLCVDKKVSAVNGLLGRGRAVIAEQVIPAAVCHDILRTTPEELVNLHIKKNLIGSTLAGSIRSANAHFANILLAFYLATGQDAANIVEGSQGITHAEVTAQGDLYFSCTLPNIIVGTQGAGKSIPFVVQNLTALGCLGDRPLGCNARRLAGIIGAAVWCGELSLLAAQTNRHELMRSHECIERAGSRPELQMEEASHGC